MKNHKIRRLPFTGMYVQGLILAAIILALITVQYSVPYEVHQQVIDLRDPKDTTQIKAANTQAWEKACQDADRLLVFETDDPQSEGACLLIEQVMEQMKLPYRKSDAQAMTPEKLEDVQNLILSVTHYQQLTGILEHLREWVESGGDLMILYAPENSGSFICLDNLLGIKDCGSEIQIDGIHLARDFMLGSQTDYMITEPFQSALDMTVTEDCQVYMESTDEYPVPVIWRRNAGKGTVVFDNFGIFEKSYRGIHCAALSLMGRVCAYPVINSATFYIDDFPSPVPEGDSSFIRRDYNLSIADFYSQVWWNDVYDLAEKHSLIYTGLIVESYEDKVKAPFARNSDTIRYRYYGNMLLQQGGELGIHGYNHMPLVLPDFDYASEFDSYNPWPSEANMAASIREVQEFAQNLFPDQSYQVYVPPSNILSHQGESVLKELGVRVIAAIYLPGDLAREQEFEVAENGIIQTPRTVSGYIFNDYTKITAFSELNFHLVSTHFQHPDDVLDTDRGAELGWETMFERLESYVEWLYTSTPQIRTLTGSELAGAVERYDLTWLTRRETADQLKLDLDHFRDEEWILLRLNDGQKIASSEGADYTEIAQDLYLIRCSSPQVRINYA